MYKENKARPLVAMSFLQSSRLEQSWYRVSKGTFLLHYTEIGPLVSDNNTVEVFFIHVHVDIQGKISLDPSGHVF